jgi:putative phage-type endonuclease
MKIITCEQRSAEWFEARLGIPSASCFSQIITCKGEPSKQAQKYMYKLAGEKVSGKAEETYQNAAMLRGVEMEDEARQLYQIITNTEVVQVGLCLSDGEYQYGCSPDGLVGKNGGMEIKCPTIATHVEYLLNNALPSEYFQQVQGSLFVTGLKWWDFMSYYPGLKPLIIRVTPDKAFHKALKTEIEGFCIKLNEVIHQIN